MANFTSASVAALHCGNHGHKIETHKVGVELGPNQLVLERYETFCVICGLSLEKIRSRVRTGNKKGQDSADS